MATQVFSDVELNRLRGIPGIGREELVRFFTLTPADESFVRSQRGPVNRLGVAVQLCTLAWLGFVPDDVGSAPAEAVQRLADHLRIPAETLGSHGGREQTRTDHLVKVAKFLGWRQPGEAELKESLRARTTTHHNRRRSRSGRRSRRRG